MQQSYLFSFCIARSDMYSELNVAHGVSKTIRLVAVRQTVKQRSLWESCSPTIYCTIVMPRTGDLSGELIVT